MKGRGAGRLGQDGPCDCAPPWHMSGNDGSRGWAVPVRMAASLSIMATSCCQEWGGQGALWSSHIKSVAMGYRSCILGVLSCCPQDCFLSQKHTLPSFIYLVLRPHLAVFYIWVLILSYEGP